MTARTALYARVSTARQEQEQTVGSQLEALEHAAKELGVTVASDRRYIDEGFSGSRLDRPGLDALRDAAADGLLDQVLVYCPDRLARNYVHQHVLIEELDRRGVQVHFVECPIGERAEDRLLVQMQGVIAEYERAKIMERTRRGKLHKLRSGTSVPYSNQAPYGYAIVRVATGERAVVIDEVEAENVRTMFRWVMDESLSARAVAKRLNMLGIRPRKASAWGSSTIYCLLTNPAYAGQATYNRRESMEPKRPKKPGAYRRNAKSSRRKRPEMQWVQVPIPALVDESVMGEVRARLANNKLTSMRNTHHEYLLRTLVVCGQCDRRMECSRQKHSKGCSYEYFYYNCRHRDREVWGAQQHCTAQRVRRDELDAVVWDAITTWVQSPQMLLQEVEAWQASRGGSEQVARDRARLQGAERHLRDQVDRLIDGYQRGALAVEELKVRRERIESSLDAVRGRLEELAGQEMDRARLDQLGDDLEAFAATLRSGLDKLDFQGRQRLVRLLVERVVVTGDRVAIEHAIPLSGRFCGFASTAPRSRPLAAADCRDRGPAARWPRAWAARP
jgi:site-specific DNA recombinase